MRYCGDEKGKIDVKSEGHRLVRCDKCDKEVQFYGYFCLQFFFSSSSFPYSFVMHQRHCDGTGRKKCRSPRRRHHSTSSDTKPDLTKGSVECPRCNTTVMGSAERLRLHLRDCGQSRKRRPISDNKGDIVQCGKCSKSVEGDVIHWHQQYECVATRPHKCKQCSKSFRTVATMKNHILRLHTPFEKLPPRLRTSGATCVQCDNRHFFRMDL